MDNALSIDLEDWYHPQLIQPHLGDVPKTSRVVEATEPLLLLLERCGVRATFFCVGEVARQHPDLMRRIHDSGHEIGFHTMTHRPLWDLTPKALDLELKEFDGLIREILGPQLSICGFRAPTFSLDRRTAWALPILKQNGYEYDSSVFPMRSPLYGLSDAPLGPYFIDLEDPAAANADSRFAEFPVAVSQLGGVRIPVGGGVYLRLLPLEVVVRLLARINQSRPFALYLHPWEMDEMTPRIPIPLAARIATYTGLGRTLGSLERLLGRFRFTTLSEVLDRWAGHRSSDPEEAQC